LLLLCVAMFPAFAIVVARPFQLNSGVIALNQEGA
jgi:hypothetical protein